MYNLKPSLKGTSHGKYWNWCLMVISLSLTLCDVLKATSLRGILRVQRETYTALLLFFIHKTVFCPVFFFLNCHFDTFFLQMRSLFSCHVEACIASAFATRAVVLESALQSWQISEFVSGKAGERGSLSEPAVLFTIIDRRKTRTVLELTDCCFVILPGWGLSICLHSAQHSKAPVLRETFWH